MYSEAGHGWDLETSKDTGVNVQRAKPGDSLAHQAGVTSPPPLTLRPQEGLMIDTTFSDPGTNGGQPAKETQTHKPEGHRWEGMRY